MGTLPKALTDMLEPVVQLERLETWANDHGQRFFDITRYSGGAWNVTLYSEAVGSIDSYGDTLVEAVQNAFKELENQS